jgi:hypothetical protein
MPSKVHTVIGAIGAAALASAALLYALQPSLPPDWVSATACMAAWGLVAQVLGHRIGSASTISIASIPYLTALFLVPRLEVVGAVLITDCVMSVVRHRTPEKALFNAAQVVLAFTAGALTFGQLGGHSLLLPGRLNVVAYVAATAAVFLVNTVTVSLVIAVSEGKAFRSVWYAATKGAAVNNLLALPLPFLFAQLFVARGVWGAVFLAVPLLAIRQVFRTSWQLETVTQDLLQLMVKAIEARDPYTSGHSQRVQQYALIIGRTIGLSARALERLGRAALLHDVGKIHEVYAPILRKPDKLTPAERALMQTHPVKSAELVSAVSHLKDIVASIRHHHENWDGSGYPDGLTGDRIPLFARIIAIADTIDAMTTDRSYRRALPIETVAKELSAKQGHQFDPSLCNAILTRTQFEKLCNAIGSNGVALAPAEGPVRRVV